MVQLVSVTEPLWLYYASSCRVGGVAADGTVEEIARARVAVVEAAAASGRTRKNHGCRRCFR